jgi:hypothetical protein
MAASSAYEACRKRLMAAEQFHKRNFSQEVKNTASVILNNTISVYESYAGLVNGNSGVAQMNPVTSYKNFIITIASLGIPALDVFDWVATEPMATANTQILFTRFFRMSDKGNSQRGDIISDPFGVNYRINQDGSRSGAIDSQYTSTLTSDSAVVAVAGTSTISQLRWKPVRLPSMTEAHNFSVVTGAGLFTMALADSAAVQGDGSVLVSWTTPATLTAQVASSGAITVTGDAGAIPATSMTVTYEYDNVSLPANDIPTYGSKVEAIPMAAEPHKLRITFDALSNLIYKHDYGIDLAKELPKKAIEQFMFDIANEVSDSIVREAPTSVYTMAWSLAAPDGWIAQHYASFGSVLAAAQDAIAEVTQVYAGNRAFIGGALLPVVRALPGFKPADVEGKIGTQLIGSYGDIKIYRKPGMDRYTYVVFSKGQGTELSVGLLSIYMAVLPGTLVPTQLIETADGLSSQGFYSLYAYKTLNPVLSVKGTVSH